MKKVKKLPYLLLALVVLCVWGYVYLMSDFDKSPPTLYHNANIITLNEQQPMANTMLVREGRIVAIGQEEELLLTEQGEYETIDLQGATLMPGFIDAHTHFALSMFMAEMHDLSGFKHRSNEEVWQFFEEVVANTPAGEWIVCKGIDPVLVPNLKVPALSYLDSVTTRHPVVIFSQSLHSYWANSLAFEQAGVTAATPAPSSHSYYAKDDNGQLTGMIVEQEAFRPFIEKVQEEVLTPAFLSKIAAKVMRDYARNGNTTIASTGLTIDNNRPLLLLEHLSGEKPKLFPGFLSKLGLLPQRSPYPRHMLYMRHDMAHLMPNTAKGISDFYRVLGVKHWYDGSPYIGSMYLNDPYVESELTLEELKIPPGHRGAALIEKEALTDFIKKYHLAGWQISIHTQGDAAISEVLDVFESLSKELDFSQSRHRLEHGLLLPEYELVRMKRLGITPSYHINHLYYYGDALKNEMLGTERTEKILPLGATARQGIRFSLHADQPMFESKPFRLIQTAIERQTQSGDTINAGQRINLMAAIRAMTIDAAWQLQMDQKIGTLEVGKYADFIALDRDPFKCPTAELENIKCTATYVNGELVE